MRVVTNEDLKETRGERMRRAMRASGGTVEGMAEQMGVNRATVSTWLNDHNRPAVASVALWAVLTGTRAEWLETGQGLAVEE